VASVHCVRTDWVDPEVWRRIDCVNRVRRTVVRATDARLVDLGSWRFPSGPKSCRVTQNGVVLRPDGLHFRDEGARIAARWILQEARRKPS